MSDEKRSDLNSDRLGAGATAGGPAVGGGSWNAMPFESLAELQEESTRNALSSLLSDCEERFLTAARLLQIANPVTDRIQESKSKGGTSLAPLYPMWHVICRRYRREFDGAQPSLFASDSGGTWPVRTEYTGNLKTKRSALASSIVLVCRPRNVIIHPATRREFVTTLKAELPAALAELQASNIAPVDLAQAAIGPGMAVYTRYSKVLDAEGRAVTVRDALALINEVLDEALTEQEGDFDADTRWALTWFDQSGFTEGDYGVAETLSKAKNTSVSGMVEAGILSSSRGKVRLLKPAELPKSWDPATDTRLTVWEIVHHLLRLLEAGELEAAKVVAKLGAKAEVARELAYRLYTLCERKKRAADALSYNALVQSWPELLRLAQKTSSDTAQGGLFGEE